MRRKIIAIIIIAVFAVLAFRLTSTLAQRHDRDSDYVKKEDFALIEEKIDKILSILPEKGVQELANRNIADKLDQIISNQQRILSELDTVKVRATRR